MGRGSTIEEIRIEGCDSVNQRADYIHRLGIPRSITTDQGTMFTGEEMNYFAMNYGIQLIRLTHFYAQANGQAEASNKVLIGILEKML